LEEPKKVSNENYSPLGCNDH